MEEKRNSSFFASASRFFKSTSNIKPTTPSRSSSLSGRQTQTEPDSVTTSQPRPEPQRVVVKEQLPPLATPVQQQLVKEDSEEEDTNEVEQIIEDEATRAFADETITFSTRTIDYASSLSPELLADNMDSFKLRTPLLPSVSTPTHSVATNTVDVDPWAISLQMEPSTSSPVNNILTQDIEPQKRRVFADLITSWTTGQSNIFETRPVEDPEQFFQHVAEEQRDVGFAGIDDSPIRTNAETTTVNIWGDVENPWS
ncbi:hypothetical protein G6F64_009678 [Rhizopus arrhizus]|uniref:Uncharacterized protein n=1 Tax=Rhizopus oryzae TaxID=64495 RepID=A0A9P6X2H3_RHIOR|nr:hypothetical protein G6F64_009678 [Rhizopus arrhizus]